MKFIFADSIDVVDPSYDFATEQSAAAHHDLWDDRYAHEVLNPTPYDGVLVSLGTVGDSLIPGKYSSPQVQRLRRDGARKFLRLDDARFKHMPIYGDSGAFSYIRREQPPYTSAQLLDFYADGGFTHGCALDHIILDFEREEGGPAKGSKEARRRSEITLENAREFLRLSKELGAHFTPIGVAQGWSPSSVGDAAGQLEKMGYSFIAVGGLVPLRSADIHRCMTAVRERMSVNTRVHLLGFAKAEAIGEFEKYGIESFDSTSPFLRAFKDARSNYYALTEAGLEYYTAVRIPQALGNLRLVRAAKEGRLHQESLIELERKALEAVRGYDRGIMKLEDAAKCVADYGSLLADDPADGPHSREKLRSSILIATERTLRDRPWSKCPCNICRAAGVEVVIFRGSERNKRRGFHNLGVFLQHVRRLTIKRACE